MPNNKNISRKAPTIFGVLRRHKILAFAIVLFMLAAVSIAVIRVYNASAIRAEKASFLQAELDIENISRDILAAAGPPLKTDKTKSCSRPNMKFNNGPLTCDVSYIHFYGVEDSQQANALHKKVVDVARSTWKFERDGNNQNKVGSDVFSAISGNEYIPDSDYQRSTSLYETKFENIPCKLTSIFYRSKLPPFSNFPSYAIQDNTLAVKVICGGDAKYAHFIINS